MTYPAPTPSTIVRFTNTADAPAAPAASGAAPVTTRVTDPAATRTLARVSSTRVGPLSAKRLAPVGKNVPCTSIATCTAVWLNTQNEPSASTGTTDRFDTATPATWFPFDLTCGPAVNTEHRSAVTYPAPTPSTIVRFTNTADAPAAPAATRVTDPAASRAPTRVSSTRVGVDRVNARPPARAVPSTIGPNHPCRSAIRSTAD